ncbi:MAG: diacylglycerol kinase family protein [Oscillospiraceae bacterium]|jgi:diacylglycerol kinase (ATP)|nr:diacylglycerol kinase family protein [Oscillospiraceae bacterium]
MKHFLNSFKYAVGGIFFCIKYERNMRIHIVITIYVLYFSTFYEFTRVETILLILTCVAAVSLEMVNTAIEVVIDKVSPNYHTLAKIGKDVAAGAVLIATIAAVAIGIMLFWNTEMFVKIWFYFTGSVINGLLMLGSVLLAVFFINSGKKRKARIRKKVEQGQEKEKNEK